MKEDIDFVVVNSLVWKLLTTLYKGGPALIESEFYPK